MRYSISKFNQSKYTWAAGCFIIFLIMLIANILTEKCADDFLYSYNLATNERLASFWEIFPSIATHYKTMNGRVFAHFMAQVFLFIPPIIFKVINSGVFLLQILLIYRICNKNQKSNVFLLASVFSLVWIFEPAFGQVNLWVDGACNYLWGIVVGLLFLYPYISKFLHEKTIQGIIKQVLFVAFGLMVGWWSENTSSAVVFIAVIIVGIEKFYYKKKVEIYYLLSIISAIVGYFFMVMGPAAQKNKAVSVSFNALCINLINIVKVFKDFWPLLLLFAILLIISRTIKINEKKQILSVVFCLGAIFANAIMLAAKFYPERCAICPVILLVIADGLLMSELFCTQYKTIVQCIFSGVLIAVLYFLVIGIGDIYATHVDIKTNNQYIVECREAGIMDVELDMVVAKTKYSALYGLKYLDTEDVKSWPNEKMARDYGVNSIIGKYKEDNM